MVYFMSTASSCRAGHCLPTSSALCHGAAPQLTACSSLRLRLASTRCQVRCMESLMVMLPHRVWFRKTASPQSVKPACLCWPACLASALDFPVTVCTPLLWCRAEWCFGSSGFLAQTSSAQDRVRPVMVGCRRGLRPPPSHHACRMRSWPATLLRAVRHPWTPIGSSNNPPWQALPHG